MRTYNGMIERSEIHRALKKYFGFDCFKKNQEDIILSLLSGKDVFVLMPTGGGKSMCYQLPSLLMQGTAIVISPLIALMKNQVDAIRHTCEEDGVAHFINSSLNKSDIDQVKSDILLGKTKLLYVAPESLAKREYVEFLKTIKISFYAVDEAHCISEWGHDFRPEYRNIRLVVDEIGRAPIIALTATATDKVRLDIKKSLGIQDADEFKSSFNRANLYYEVRPKTKEINKEIVTFIRQNAGKSGIIYCLSRKTVDELAKVLQANEIKAKPYHAGLEPDERSQTQDLFLMQDIDVIVATIAFGMGIDKPDVRFVIHYDIPKSLEGYYQETGRAGRDDGEGKCITFYSPDDLKKLEKFMEKKGEQEREIGYLLLAETAAYAESSICRRKLLLHYFGEEYSKDNCGNCDNCLNPKKKVEAKEELEKVLSVVLATKEVFRAEHIKDILMGHKTESVRDYKHYELDDFGCGEDEDEHLWNAVIRQALLTGYLHKEIENYGVLKITDKGRRFMKEPVSFQIIEDQDYSETSTTEPVQSGADCAVAPELYDMLLGLRKKMSKELQVPPYVIFQDPSLEAMATVFPQTLEELKNIPGVGEGKAKRYGQAFCDLIRKYCVDNDIDRPEDIRIRTVAKNSKLKIAIIQAIDRKVALDDIATANGIEFEELLDEIESIVYYSGNKINIDYFIEDVMDPDVVDAIYEYFRESDTDDIDVALEELSEYEEDEIRLVRIKFMSEMAN